MITIKHLRSSLPVIIIAVYIAGCGKTNSNSSTKNTASYTKKQSRTVSDTNIDQNISLSKSKIYDSENTTIPVFIIGDSLTHNTMSRNGKRVGWGWGDVIDQFMKNPKLLRNAAQSGASSLSYATYMPRYNTYHFWGDGVHPSKYGQKGLAQFIKETDTSKGGFLLIQFAANDAAVGLPIDTKKRTVPEKNIQVALNEDKNIPKGLTSFETNLRRYIDFALNHNVTPVLVTTPTTRSLLYHTCDDDDPQYAGKVGCDARRAYWINPAYSKYETHPFRGQTLDYPQAMRDLQKEYTTKGKTVLLLDLTRASYDFYLNDAKQHGKTTTNDIYNYLKKYSYGDYVHTNKLGADSIASLVKMLACKTSMSLCYQFKQ